MGRAALLFYNPEAGAQSLHARVTPTKEQRDFLQEHWNALAGYLTERLEELSGYPISTWIQGSYKFGTLIRPLSKGEEYDVDLGAYFGWSNEGAEPAPAQLKAWVQRSLLEYLPHCDAAREVEKPPKERCSRLYYVKQFHIDAPAYHLDAASDKRRLATQTKGWEPSDPKALYLWFQTVVANPERDQVRRLVRYMKAWAVVAFQENDGARPTSVLLTVLVAQAYLATGCGDENRDDEDAFGTVAAEILRRLRIDRRVLNPSAPAPHEDLNRISAAGFGDFMVKLSELVDIAQRAFAASDEVGAALAWADAFSYVFPLPESASVEMVDAAKQPLMAIPNIRIDVSDRKSGRVLPSHMNEVPSVPKDCNLRFVITNPEVVPPFATVEWVVRNEGSEAEAIGDLGHKNARAQGTAADEHTAYAGRHFMDCTVKHNGSVWAVRRVPVHVLDVSYPARNPPRPPYVRLRSFGRRR